MGPTSKLAMYRGSQRRHQALVVVAAVVAQDAALDGADAGRHHPVGQGLHGGGQPGLAGVAAVGREVGGGQEGVAPAHQPQVGDGAALGAAGGPDLGGEAGVAADLGQGHRAGDQLEGGGGDEGLVGLAGVDGAARTGR